MMLSTVLYICVLWIANLARLAALWPQPVSLNLGTNIMKLDPDVTFINLNASSAQSDTIIDAAIARCQAQLRDGFIPWKLSIPGEVYELDMAPAASIHQVYIWRLSPSQRIEDENSSESYQLQIEMDGKIYISSESTLGIMHGLNTLTQLFYTHSDGRTIYTKSAPVSINDVPYFKWRGLNVDVSRNFLTIDDLKKIIDAMSWNKMNRLHLHATDSQSWPLTIPSFPELAAEGSFSPTATYSTTDFELIQAFGQQRGVEIVTEIDMPGHTASIAKAYPELITGYNIQSKSWLDSTSGSPALSTTDWSAYCAEPPCGQLKLGSDEVDDFLKRLLADLLPRVKNYTSYFHAGGDEINKNVYLLQEGLNTNQTAVLQPLLSHLVLAVHEHIRQQGLRPIAWQEVLLDWNIALLPDVIVQSWVDQESIKKIISKGYKVIAGSSTATYLDCGKGQWLDFTPATVVYQASQGFVDYCTPFKNWKEIYHYDPLFNLTEAERPYVEGFEVHAWSEQMDSINFETVIWPRAAAAAEVGWSGPVSTDPSRSFEDVGARLSEWRERMVQRGVSVEPIHSLWCTQRPGQCSL